MLKTEGFAQDCRGVKQNDRIEMRKKRESWVLESKGEGNEGKKKKGKNSHNEDKCMMK